MKLYFLALATLLIVCVGCAYDTGHSGAGPHGPAHAALAKQSEFVAPPAAMLAAPGPMVAGPGPGVMGHPPVHLASMQSVAPGPGGYAGAPAGPGGVMPAPIAATSQFRFLGPAGMSIGWQVGNGFADNQLVAPARYNFRQGATYRLKFTGIPGREGLVLYPSLHVYPARPSTEAYLSHNTIPVQSTDEDLDQIQTNNFVTKVIYLPDARFQDLAAGVEELVSTALPAGEDPVKVAERRGTIMAVLRIGNMDLEMPGQLNAAARRDADGNIVQTAFHADGDKGEHVPPTPIAVLGVTSGVPDEMMMGGPTHPGGPPWNPVAGVTAPMWGHPHMDVGTPIGLPGPVHLPYGRPAGLRSHTMRNLTETELHGPVNDVLIDVAHQPGIRMPAPVRHVEYIEKHPLHPPGGTSWPAWAGSMEGGAYCPPGTPQQ